MKHKKHTEVKEAETVSFYEGDRYELDYKGGRETFTFKGQDIAANYTFVTEPKMLKVPANKIGSVNAKKAKA